MYIQFSAYILLYFNWICIDIHVAKLCIYNTYVLYNTGQIVESTTTLQRVSLGVGIGLQVQRLANTGCKWNVDGWRCSMIFNQKYTTQNIDRL